MPRSLPLILSLLFMLNACANTPAKTRKPPRITEIQRLQGQVTKAQRENETLRAQILKAAKKAKQTRQPDRVTSSTQTPDSYVFTVTRHGRTVSFQELYLGARQLAASTTIPIPGTKNKQVCYKFTPTPAKK